MAIKIACFGAGETPQQVKLHAAKPDDLSSIPYAHVPTHVNMQTPMHANYTHIHMQKFSLDCSNISV